MNEQKYIKKNIFIVMGIILVILFIVVLYIFLFNFKTLTCSISEDTMGIDLSTELKMKFKGKDVSNADISMVFDLGTFSNYKEQMLKTIENQYSSEEFKKMNLKITSDDTKIYVNMQSTKENFKEAGFSTEGTYKEVKADLEQQGFTCK